MAWIKARRTTVLFSVFLAACHTMSDDKDSPGDSPVADGASIEANFAASLPQEAHTRTGGTVRISLPADFTTPFRWYLLPSAGITLVATSFARYRYSPVKTGEVTFVLRVATPGPHDVRCESRRLGSDSRVENRQEFVVTGV